MSSCPALFANIDLEAMKKIAAALIVPALLLAACKKTPPAEAPAPAPVVVASPSPAPATPPAEMSDAEREMAKKKDLLAYGTMEDNFLNDVRGQWATSVTASSTFNGVDPKKATGKPDGNSWLNNNQDVGFDWIELGYDKPVQATEVRLAIEGGQGVEALTRVELQDTDGKWNKVWEGVSDVKKDARGRRTWFVKTFDKTPYKVKAVKYTIANNMYRGYKEFDAAQLVGD
jgi:hypothetical protein